MPLMIPFVISCSCIGYNAVSYTHLSSFSVDSALIKYVNNTRLFLKGNNQEVEEYIFE